MNGGQDYGALATPYFILFNEYVAGSITSQGRELTKRMDIVNVDYWTNLWHNDFELHHKMSIKDVTPIGKKENVSIYADTDSLFVSFEPAIKHCNWKNIFLNDENIRDIDKRTFIIDHRNNVSTDNEMVKVFYVDDIEERFDSEKLKDQLNQFDPETVIIDGAFVKNWQFNSEVLSDITCDIKWDWQNELDFIQGLDHFRYAGYFKKCLEEYAAEYGVENKEDFELERISESIINIAKKKYIQHILFEDGINYNRLSYIFPKGVELVRSSTPAFARDKIVNIVKYLFSHPDDFNIKDLLKLVKELRREFELADIDSISMQSSVNKYEEKVLNDRERLTFVTGTHFAVKASAYHNFLLHKNRSLQSKYEFLRSGNKIKYYYCKDSRINPIFAFQRGSYPIEIAPDIDYDTQFDKCILSPINAIISPLGLPEITKRLTVVLNIFGSGF